MKVLEKDRTRRYATVGDLSADLQRHLDNEPVLASPPSAVYRPEKFVRRNRIACYGGGTRSSYCSWCSRHDDRAGAADCQRT